MSQKTLNEQLEEAIGFNAQQTCTLIILGIFVSIALAGCLLLLNHNRLNIVYNNTMNELQLCDMGHTEFCQGEQVNAKDRP